MSKILKFKIFDTKINKIIQNINCCIDVNGQGVQSFSNKGFIEGTIKNKYLIPLQYTNKNDIKGTEIYDGYIIKREYEVLGGNDITGVVKFDECAWWIVNEIEQRSEILFDEIAIDIILGNKWENPELLKKLNIREEV